MVKICVKVERLTNCIGITLAGIKHVAVKHEQRNIHIVSSYRIAVAIFGSITCPPLKQIFAGGLPDQRRINGFKLSKDVLLGWTTIKPRILRITKPIEGREKTVSISHELVCSHEPSSDVAKGFTIVRYESASYRTISVPLLGSLSFQEAY